MFIGRPVGALAALWVASAVFCSAQNIASAHAGLVYYFEGDVTLDGVQLVPQVARFADLTEQSVLGTGLGRAEILLTPGVLLRIGENTSIKMLDSRLLSTRVELLSGIAVLECVESDAPTKYPAVTIVYKDFRAQPARFGIFEMMSEPGQVRVFEGNVKVTGRNTSLTVKNGNLINISTAMAIVKFDAKKGDDLYIWTRDRSAYLSADKKSSPRTRAIDCQRLHLGTLMPDVCR